MTNRIQKALTLLERHVYQQRTIRGDLLEQRSGGAEVVVEGVGAYDEFAGIFIGRGHWFTIPKLIEVPQRPRP